MPTSCNLTASANVVMLGRSPGAQELPSRSEFTAKKGSGHGVSIARGDLPVIAVLRVARYLPTGLAPNDIAVAFAGGTR